VLLHRKVRASKLANKSANGSVNSSQRRFASLYSMTSDGETTYAGLYSTADGRDGLSALPNKRFDPTLRTRDAGAGSD